jgi:hypothetical protein
MLPSTSIVKSVILKFRREKYLILLMYIFSWGQCQLFRRLWRWRLLLRRNNTSANDAAATGDPSQLSVGIELREFSLGAGGLATLQSQPTEGESV